MSRQSAPISTGSTNSSISSLVQPLAAVAALGGIGYGINKLLSSQLHISKSSTSKVLQSLASQSYSTTTGSAIKHNIETGNSLLPVEYFGINVFDKRAQSQWLPAGDFDRLQKHIQQGKSIDGHLADVFANSLLKWAAERGATHYCHWYQPISDHTGQKHDTFLDTARDNETPLSKFSGKQLIMGETDGSSAPNGHLRSTHTARAYLAWDPTSPPFVIQHSTGATVYIPAILFSWKDGHALDEKIPLLRSETALAREALNLFDVLGEQYSDHHKIHMDAGLEQEFFIIDRKLYLQRPDLYLCGRTLQGAAPSRGQELEDQYYGAMGPRFLDCIHEFERECWKLGIPVQTRHKEVAPGQYEIAPKFAPANIGTDRNLIMMQILKNTACKHGLSVLFHEKPFAGINGSGKHNNWSLGSNKSPSLFSPGPIPERNLLFMLTLAATIRAVDMHGDLMRVAISGASNDHRLGANEAPPAIVSVYLGDDIQLAVDRFISGKTDAPQLPQSIVDLGIPVLPEIKKATCDRNRTSTFAFTSNKFEFRAVGSSHNPSRSNQILNTIVAESLKYIADEVDQLKSTGKSVDQSITHVVREILNKHQRVVFNGNGYSAEWPIEAAKRGLPNLKSTPDALDEISSQKNIDLFSKLKVLSKPELLARQTILYEEYTKKISIEGRTLVKMTQNSILPCAIEYQTILAQSITSVNNAELTKIQSQQLHEYTRHINQSIQLSNQLIKTMDSIDDSSAKVAARYALEKIKPACELLRVHLDRLESLIPADKWPYPTYAQMLFNQDC